MITFLARGPEPPPAPDVASPMLVYAIYKVTPCLTNVEFTSYKINYSLPLKHFTYY